MEESKELVVLVENSGMGRRADEAQKCADRAVVYADNHGQEIFEGNLRGLRAFILNGIPDTATLKDREIPK